MDLTRPSNTEILPTVTPPFHLARILNILLGLKDLTGEAVEVIMLDDKSYSMKPDELWNTLVNNIKG